MRCISPFDNGSYHTGTIRTNRTNRELERGFLGLAYSVLGFREIFKVPLMRCISPFDNGSYHTGTIRTNRTNRQLGQASLSIERVANILSLANEMYFSIRQRVVSHRHDSYKSNELRTRKRVPWLTAC